MGQMRKLVCRGV